MPSEKENQWMIFQNIATGHDRKSIIQEFNENAHYIKSTPKRRLTMRFHEILAFSHKNSDDLTREKLQAIAHTYLKLRDPENSSLALCVPHREKGGHSHIHILLSSNAVGSSKSGDRMMTNFEYYEIRRKTERWMLENYPELHHSTVYLPEKEILSLIPDTYKAERRLMELDEPKQKGSTAKDQVAEMVKSMLDKSNSMNEFIERINKLPSFQTYSRRGKLTGIIHEGKKKFRFSTLGINQLEENFTVLSRMNELETMRKDSSQSIER
jgi:hypothetical protein